MKCLPALFLFLILSSSNIKGQALTANIGLNHSNITINQSTFETQHQRSLAIGLGLSDSISSRLSWNLDGLYSIKGYETKGVFIEGLGFLPDGVNNLRIHYVELLPSAEVHLTKFLSLIGGAALGINVLETYNGERTSTNHNRIDLGLITGLKFNVDRYSLKAIVNPSLTKATDFVLTDINGDPIDNYNNINLQATLGIRIFEFDGYNY